jgi:hypothetical protein
VNLGELRAILPKQLEVVAYNRSQCELRLNGGCEYSEVKDWETRLCRSEGEADRIAVLIRECEWGERMPPHP